MYHLVHPNNVEGVWHLVAPWIAHAIGDSDTWGDLPKIKEMAKDGIARIWVGKNEKEEIDIVLVTETWFFDGRKTLVLRWLCGKDRENWFQDLDLVEAWAISNGYHTMHVWGRPGWKKVMKPLAYKHEFTVLSKPLIRGLH